MTAQVGQVLGRYELLVPVASGTSGQVWAARLKGTGGFQKIVAIKTMHPQLGGDATSRRMLLDEATLASKIHHPHVVQILDLGEQDGLLYLAMEWVDGSPLTTILRAAAERKEPVPLPIALRIAMQACAGLQAAHELRDDSGALVGLVHRDVSPQNILLARGGVAQIADFGVAKGGSSGDPMAEGVGLKGTAAYSAPEQVMDGAVDRRTDLFAVGIVLYELTTGRHPFKGENDLATMSQICSPEPAPAPRSFKPDYPEALEAVVLKALEKEPDARFATASDMMRALDRVLPAKDRVSADDEVAAFVQKLLGDEQANKRAALARALRDADERATLTAVAVAADRSGVNAANDAARPSAREARGRRAGMFAGGLAAVVVILAVVLWRGRAGPVSVGVSAEAVSAERAAPSGGGAAPTAAPSSSPATQTSPASLAESAGPSASPSGASSASTQAGSASGLSSVASRSTAPPATAVDPRRLRTPIIALPSAHSPVRTPGF